MIAIARIFWYVLFHPRRARKILSRACAGLERAAGLSHIGLGNRSRPT